MGVTFLTDRFSLAVALALFVVGGFGLGRDIEMEESLERARRRAEALAREAEHAQLLALKSHLDPHFLFNTLNAIAEWCREDGEVAERATLTLSAMLRTVLAGVRERAWPLEKELELVETLFSLHLFRDPELFVFVRDVESDLPSLTVPPMLLLPLAENAVKHGPAAGKRGEIVLRVVREGDAVAITIANPGSFSGPRDGGEGLGIVEKRLALAYEGSARFRISNEPTSPLGRTVAEVRLPLAMTEPKVHA
jgi:LytS/YehU family sensor histidine kinase